MKKIAITTPHQVLFLLGLTFLSIFNVFSQDRKSYYIRITENTNLGTIQKTVNPDETLTLTTSNTNFSNYLNSKNIYEFKEAFPGAETSNLQRVYKVTMAINEPYTDLLQ